MLETAFNTQNLPAVNHVFGMRRSMHHPVIKQVVGWYEEAGVQASHVNDAYHGHLSVLFEQTGRNYSVDDVLKKSEGSSVAIVSYEDLPYYRRHEAAAYALPSTKDVVVVRDWFNLVASRLLMDAQANGRPRYALLDMLPWEGTAELWDEYSRLLANPGSSSLLVVNTNKWFVNEDYRRELANQACLPHTDKYKERVTMHGDGSSFDGLEKDGAAHTMGVLTRWQDLPLALLPDYRKVIHAFPDLAARNQELFGLSIDTVLGDLALRNTSSDADFL
ncbi:MAG TPA: hypothetical protein VJ836_03725 [Candidatus Saccharimonadales bacterium]|nr:hypothetical protein [Candidatus Saccharimonadales bacterium]